MNVGQLLWDFLGFPFVFYPSSYTTPSKVGRMEALHWPWLGHMITSQPGAGKTVGWLTSVGQLRFIFWHEGCLPGAHGSLVLEQSFGRVGQKVRKGGHVQGGNFRGWHSCLITLAPFIRWRLSSPQQAVATWPSLRFSVNVGSFLNLVFCFISVFTQVPAAFSKITVVLNILLSKVCIFLLLFWEFSWLFVCFSWEL